LSRGNDYFFPNQRYFQIFSKKFFASHNGMKETRVLLDEGFAQMQTFCSGDPYLFML
jgi:hypothetical protein